MSRKVGKFSASLFSIAICANPLLKANATDQLCPKPYVEIAESEQKKIAESILTSLTKGIDRLKEIYGDDVLESERRDVEPYNGEHGLANIFLAILLEEGYPSLNDRNNCTTLLPSEFDEHAMTILVMTTPNVDHLDHLMANLKELVE